MSVRINYHGRCGNRVFQYVSARLFAEKNSLNLNTELGCDIVKTKPSKRFDEVSTISQVRMNHKSFENDELVFQGRNFDYIFDDFFQNCKYINNNKELVKSLNRITHFIKKELVGQLVNL